MNWPTISAAPRFRTSFCVPVWQNRQLSGHPTWLLMHTAPRSSVRSGIYTVSASCPSRNRNSHFRVSSPDVCTTAASGRPTTKRSASFACNGRAMLDIMEKSVTP